MSNIKVETARKLDLSSVKSSSMVYSPSKSCGITQNRRFRSYSATLNRNGSEDQPKTPKKIGQSNNSNQSSTITSGVGNFSSATKRRHGSFSAGAGGGGGGGSANAGSGSGSCGLGGFKRRKKEPGIVPPTKFLLGGNITDPLNLNSFVDETGRSPNQATPSASPLPVPKNRSQVEVLIPPNINDPLNLNAGDEDAELDLNLVSPKTKKRRRKNRNKKRASEETAEEETISKPEVVSKPEVEESMVATETTGDEVEQKVDGVESLKPIVPNTLALNMITIHSQHKFKKTDDKIVSPVIPQPGSRKNRSGHSRNAEIETLVAPPSTSSDPIGSKSNRPHHRQRKQSEQNSRSGPTFRAKDAEFRYGNYKRYYGYRNPQSEEDYRLDCLKINWFEGKDVLDIGCNIGHITLSVARDLRPKKIVGIDIDKSLIKIARRNVCHYLTETKDNKFPISLSICCGPIAVSAVESSQREDDQRNFRTFPNNVCFVEGNYVLESNEMLEMQRPEFDTILCLSVTKWVHLNWGDEGLKRLFKRIFRQLRPGGRFILEAQAFVSYKRKKKLTEEILHNYERIRLRPENFTEYLLSKEVGFTKCEAIDTPFNHSRGFRRPIQLFTKGGLGLGTIVENLFVK